MKAAVPHPNALRALQSRLRFVTVASAVVIAPIAVWAFWPTSAVKVEAGEVSETNVVPPESAPVPAVASLPALDVEAFNAPLWTVAQPPPPPAAAPSSPPMKLQLLGIDTTMEQGDPVYRAVLYDPDQDKVLVLRSGESVGPRVVKSVDKHSVTLAVATPGPGRPAGQDHVLLLHPEDGPTAPTGGRTRP